MNAERIAELREWLCGFEKSYTGHPDSDWVADHNALIDLLAVLDELGRLRGLQKVVDRQQFADVLTKKELRAALYEWQTRAEKDEAELKRVRPLVEAVDGADPKVHWDTGVPTGFWDDDRDEIIRAALALKEGKK